MTLKAYQSTQRIAENPRETEYRLFGQVTGAHEPRRIQIGAKLNF